MSDRVPFSPDATSWTEDELALNHAGGIAPRQRTALLRRAAVYGLLWLAAVLAVGAFVGSAWGEVLLVEWAGKNAQTIYLVCGVACVVMLAVAIWYAVMIGDVLGGRVVAITGQFTMKTTYSHHTPSTSCQIGDRTVRLLGSATSMRGANVTAYRLPMCRLVIALAPA